MRSAEEEEPRPASEAPTGRVWRYVVCYPAGDGGWVLVTAGAPQPAVSARVLAEQARGSFRLPLPVPGSSPPGGTLVNLPTYLYVSGGPWAPLTASAQVPGTSVQVTAAPRRVVWRMGERRPDGRSTVTCTGPGRPYERAAQQPECTYRYRQTSKAQLGASDPGYPVTATVVWEITWTCTGVCDEAGGALAPLTPSSTMRLPVLEARAELVSAR